MRFLARKSIPTVGWVREVYIGRLVKTIMDVFLDETGFAHGLPSEEDDLHLGLAGDRAADRMIHNDSKLI